MYYINQNLCESVNYSKKKNANRKNGRGGGFRQEYRGSKLKPVYKWNSSILEKKPLCEIIHNVVQEI